MGSAGTSTSSCWARSAACRPLTELGIFSVMWSEHCSYKSSRVWLKKLPTEGPQVIQGPGENAGVVDLGDGQAAVFKMESHNHPSLYRALSGRGDRRRRHHARRVHHGRAARRQYECATVRRTGPPQDQAPGRRRGVGHRRLRQLHGRADRRRRDQFRSALQRQYPGQCDVRRAGRRQPHLQVRRQGRRPSRGLCRLEDRPRRHPRRHHGVGGVRRSLAGEASRRYRWATRSPRSCCSRPASS